MWVFGYGSLMWDGWEKDLKCSGRSVAHLDGHQRTFNKGSVQNWGTKKAPCPTLNLEAADRGVCKGMAFEFPDDQEKKILKELEDREGKAFTLEKRSVRLDSGAEVEAYVPIYGGKNIIEGTVAHKAGMVKAAKGIDGSGVEYVKGIAAKLSDLGIDDAAVTELWEEVQKP